ncbi:hypothetical protein F4677DRAFT_454196 [Hypoxylon crocopeplum]|nr:hypothetical protein F4677DRAFT_454196 [Hypoxylon crocopeplum]
MNSSELGCYCRVFSRRRKRWSKIRHSLLGATGYTGSLTAEHIVRHLPTDLKWAVAVSLDNPNQLDAVVKNSKVCISVVLYWRVGEVVVKSCVQNDTDYIDFPRAGDILLLRTFVDKYHEAAVNAGVALIHLCGACTGPQDLLTWVVVHELAQKALLKTRKVVLSVIDFELSPSGGTVGSMMAESTHSNPVLGLLSASSITAAENRALVHRTWGLLNGTDQEYRPNFQYNEYNKVSSIAAGLFSTLNTGLLSAVLSFGPGRIIAKLFLPNPGEGPDVNKALDSPVKLEAMAIADSSDDSKPPRAYASFSHPSGTYHTTALFLAQGAASLVYTRGLEGQVASGCLTPAFLGPDLLSRVQAGGATVRVQLV